MSMVVDEADVDLFGGASGSGSGSSSGNRGVKRGATDAMLPMGGSSAGGAGGMGGMRLPGKRKRGPLPLDVSYSRLLNTPPVSPAATPNPYIHHHQSPAPSETYPMPPLTPPPAAPPASSLTPPTPGAPLGIGLHHSSTMDLPPSHIPMGVARLGAPMYSTDLGPSSSTTTSSSIAPLNSNSMAPSPAVFTPPVGTLPPSPFPLPPGGDIVGGALPRPSSPPLSPAAQLPILQNGEDYHLNGGK